LAVAPASPPPPPHRFAVTARRELLVLLLALVIGLVGAPPLIWFVGSRTLGPYAGGALGDLFGAVLRGLASGLAGYWIVVLGPYVFIMLLRALVRLARGPRAAE
jgi:hypothetical protein